VLLAPAGPDLLYGPPWKGRTAPPRHPRSGPGPGAAAGRSPAGVPRAALSALRARPAVSLG